MDCVGGGVFVRGVSAYLLLPWCVEVFIGVCEVCLRSMAMGSVWFSVLVDLLGFVRLVGRLCMF